MRFIVYLLKKVLVLLYRIRRHISKIRAYGGCLGSQRR